MPSPTDTIPSATAGAASEGYGTLASHRGAIDRLVSRGLLVDDGAGGWQTTRRWHSALARAALRLMVAGDAGDDLRVAMAAALYDALGEDAAERDDFGECLFVISQIEMRDLARLWHS